MCSLADEMSQNAKIVIGPYIGLGLDMVEGIGWTLRFRMRKACCSDIQDNCHSSHIEIFFKQKILC